MRKLRKMKLMELYAAIIFIILLVSAIIFATVLNMMNISVALLFINFPVALFVAILASLSIREEEEEKTTV
ncbi:MAG: hypothetical protein ACUVRA_00495 [Candidatus Bathyarchaeaceae archaeon]